jgi:hypothetical protein
MARHFDRTFHRLRSQIAYLRSAGERVGTHDVFDISTGRYTSAAPLPIGRDHMGLVPFSGQLYAIAGRIDDFDHNTSYVDVCDRRKMRSGMAVALYRERFFAIDGERRGGTCRAGTARALFVFGLPE